MGELVTIAYKSRFSGEMESLKAERSPVPGLVVNRELIGPKGRAGSGWTVTHERSGCLVLETPTKKKAIECCIALRGLCRWELSAKSLQREAKRARPVVLELERMAWSDPMNLSAHPGAGSSFPEGSEKARSGRRTRGGLSGGVEAQGREGAAGRVAGGGMEFGGEGASGGWRWRRKCRWARRG